MIPLDLINWDRWREAYGEMSLQEHQAVYDAIATIYPEQKHYTLPVIRQCFQGAVRDQTDELKVWELGGWDGSLAKTLLSEFSEPQIWRWVNFEISKVAADRGEKDADDHYFSMCLDEWLWEWMPLFVRRPQIFVATHAIEHLSWKHLKLLIQCWLETPELRHVILEAPIPDHGPVDWTGYCGTHILEVGWAEIAAVMAPAFDLVRSEGFVRHFVRRA